MVGAGLLLALPLTASRAIDYVDVPAPSRTSGPTAPLPPTAPPGPMMLAAQGAPAAPTAPPITRLNVTNGDTVTINGVTKRWEDLTPQERTRIRADIARARQDIDRELARLPEQMAQVQRDMERFRNGEFQRDMAKAREDIRRSMQEVDRETRNLRAAGVDPEEIRAELREALAEVERINVDEIVRDALASVDMERVRADIQGAGQSLDDIEHRLDEHDDHDDRDDHNDHNDH